ncbi:hypothetical protein ACWEGE_16565 [Amycolatopsis sp. NPDC004747]
MVTNEPGSVLEACQEAARKLESALESKYGRGPKGPRSPGGGTEVHRTRRPGENHPW